MNLKTIVTGIIAGILLVIAYFAWTIHRWNASQSYVQQPLTNNTPLSNAADKTDIEERKEFFRQIRADLYEEKYQQLEKLGQELMTTRARFAGGDWKLQRFHEAIGQAEGNEKAPQAVWQKHIEKVQKWTLENPESTLAQLAFGEALINYAWAARGDGFAPKVDPKNWLLYEERLNQAEQTLTKISDQGKHTILWCVSMQSLGRSKGWGLKQLTEFMEQGIAIEPLYPEVYREHALTLLPRWYGSEGDWEKFINDSSAKIGGIEGRILYSEICWRISRYYRGEEFFTQNDVDWSRIKQGFEDCEKVYGNSYRYLNAYCLLSCSKKDYSLARDLFKRIGSHWEPDFWATEQEFIEWRNYVNRGV